MTRRLRRFFTLPSVNIMDLPLKGRIEAFVGLLMFRQLMYLGTLTIVAFVSPSDILQVLPGNLINLGCYFLARTRYYKQAAWVIILEPMIGIPLLTLQHPQVMESLGAPLWLILAPPIASLVLTVRCTLVVIVGTCIAYAVIAFGTHHESYYQLMSYVLVMLSISVMALMSTLLRERNDERMGIQQAQFLRSAKLASLGEMAGGVAHELNSPLAAISLNVEMLLEELHDLPVQYEDIEGKVEGIGEVADRMAKTINSLRSFAKDGPKADPEIVLAQNWIQGALDLCHQRVHNSGVELLIVNEGFNVQSRVQAMQMSQVLVNLLNNAFDAVSAQAEKWIYLEGRVDGKFFELRVIDSGPGIPSELSNRLFQPFFTTKVFGDGSGLGLSVSRGILENHGGKLLYSRDGEHTCFTMRIPIVAEIKCA